jgi:hypothetical protein
VDVTLGKLTLSLEQSVKAEEKTSKEKKKLPRVGKMYRVIVTSCTDVALEVQSKHCPCLVSDVAILSAVRSSSG